MPEWQKVRCCSTTKIHALSLSGAIVLYNLKVSSRNFATSRTATIADHALSLPLMPQVSKSWTCASLSANMELPNYNEYREPEHLVPGHPYRALLSGIFVTAILTAMMILTLLLSSVKATASAERSQEEGVIFQIKKQYTHFEQLSTEYLHLLEL